MSKKILIFEPNIDLNSLFCEYVREMGHEPAFCTNEVQLLSLIADSVQFDVILVDINESSIACTRILESCSKFQKSAALVAMTACMDQELQSLVLSKGGHLFLRKPFDLVKILQVIESHQVLQSSERIP